MADQNLVTRILITAKDEATSVFTSFQAKAAAVMTAVIGYFGIDFLSGTVKNAANFEAAMSRVQAATGAAGAELEQLKKAAEDASLGSKFTSVEAAQGLENLAKAGLNARESLAAFPGVLALAEAGDISLGESATYVTRTIAGLGVAVEDTGRIADVLAKGANASNTSVKGLAEALSYAAPSARSLGMTLEQTVAIIGKFADAGIDASRAGTALNSILSQFKDPASKFREELSAIGITTGDFDKALRQLADSGKLGEKAIIAVGQEAGPALRGLLNQGMGALDDLKSKLDAAKGSAAETAAIMGTNLNGAISALGRTWEALTIKLGEPILPAVTQAVKDLTAGLQEAISNGTATRFGEALSSAFASAAEWAKKFAAEVDPVELTAKLQEAAGKVGVWFDAVSEGARNAGDIVRTAYGVMSGGVNIVMASIYKMGEVFSVIAASLLKDFSLIAQGLSKITFGSVSEGFKAAAAEIRISAIGMVGVATEFGAKSAEAFGAAAESAELARKGWAGLTAPTEQAAAAVKNVGESAKAATADLTQAGEGATAAGGKIVALGVKAEASAQIQQKSVKSTGVAVDELRNKYDELFNAGKHGEAEAVWKQLQGVMQQTVVRAEAAAKSTGVAVDELRNKYHELFNAGKQGEAEVVWKQLQKTLRETKVEATATADALTAAYQAMGLKSQADLKAKADEFKRHYEAIKADGTATADIISKAFQAYAEKAIEANNGVASGTIKAEAALRGVRIESDETGKAIVKIGTAGQAAGAGVKAGMSVASAAIAKVRSDAEKLADRLASLKTQQLGDSHGNQSMGNNGTYEDMRKAGVTPQQMQGMGYSAREIEDYVGRNDQAQPGFVNRTVTTSGIDTYSLGVDRGLNDAEAKKFGEIYNYYVAAANTRSRGRAAGTLGLGFGVSDYLGEQEIAVQQAVAEAKRLVSDANRKEGKNGAGASGDTFWGAPRAVTVNLNINGKITPVQVVNQGAADDLVRALQEGAAAQS